MQASQLLTAAIEAGANQALKWSSNSEELLAPLISKVCIIYVQELQSALIFSFNAKGILVRADVDEVYECLPADDGPKALKANECWVSVTVFALDKLKQNNQMTKLIKSGKLDFSGDLGILQAVSKLFDKIDIDFEEVLSNYVGDVPAYQINSTGKKLAASLQAQISALSKTLANTALDEKPIGVRAIMVMNFSDEVNSIRANVDRFEARLDQLEATVSSHTAQGKPS